MRVGNFDKQPDERRRLAIDYKDALAQGDTISGTELKSVSPAGELSVDTLVVEEPQVLFFIAGGLDNATYVVTITTTTNSGEVFEDEIRVRIKERN